MFNYWDLNDVVKKYPEFCNLQERLMLTCYMMVQSFDK